MRLTLPVRWMVVVMTMLMSAAMRAHAQAAAVGTAVVAGSVLADSTERPISGAEISLGDSVVGRSDANGAFAIPAVKPGAYTLVVRALGYHPFTTPITVVAGQRFEADLLLSRAPTQLAAVATNTDAITRARWRDGFDERRRTGVGHFIDEKTLARTPERWAQNIVGLVPGLRVIMYNGRQSFASTRGVISFRNAPTGDAFDKAQGAPIACYVQVVIDDLVRYASAVGEPLLDITQIELGSVAAAEFYTPSTVPTRFNRGGNAPCGTLVLWRHRS